MEDQIGIYLITTPSGKCYVGMTTVSFEERWRGHRKQLRNGTHPCTGLLRSSHKYGIDSLVFSVLEAAPSNTPLSVIQKLEIKWWDWQKAKGVKLLNGRPTGTGSVLHTDESRQKICDTLRTKALKKAYETVGYVIPHRICPKGKLQFGHNCTECGVPFWGKLSSKTCSKNCNGKRMAREYVPPITRDELIKLLILGESLRDIGAKYSVSAETVRRLIRRYGLYPTTNEIVSV